MSDPNLITGLIEAVQRYFALMYDCNTAYFDDVFYPTAHLHGFRDGMMVSWSADVYKDILNKRTSPKSLNAKRAGEIIMMVFASSDMAFVKVSLLISTMAFEDDLTWHRVNGKWVITSKGFHLVSSAN